MLRPAPVVDLLILGAGWTSQFLIPLLESSHISYAATTTTGHDNTIPFTFDPAASPADTGPYKVLPSAKTVLITFPLKGPGQSRLLLALYRSVHGGTNFWIQLGSTGIFSVAPGWNDEASEYDRANVRAVAEDELRGLGGCVLNLAGLYGGESRVPGMRWVRRVAGSKAGVKGKGAVHLVHGMDVARAVVGVVRKGGGEMEGKRWLVTDLRVYDWWDLIQNWAAKEDEEEEEEEELRRVQGRADGEEREGDGEGEKLEYKKWVEELMLEEGVRALPRAPEQMGRVLDSRAFWAAIGMWPGQGRLK